MIACTHPDCAAHFSLETHESDYAAETRAYLLRNADNPASRDAAKTWEEIVAQKEGWTVALAVDGWLCPKHETITTWRAGITAADGDGVIRGESLHRAVDETKSRHRSPRASGGGVICPRNPRRPSHCGTTALLISLGGL